MQLRDCYWHEWGVKVDKENAFQLYIEAAYQSNADGLARVGESLVDGGGVIRNEAQGGTGLREAAVGGSSYAREILVHL